MGALREVEQFLYRQSAALDEKRWQDFIDHFAEDGVLMRVRMLRLTHPHAWSQAPLWGTNHVVGNVMLEKESADEIVARSRFHMMEFRRDQNRHFAGTYIHHLRRARSGFEIKLQRVDMVNAQGSYEYVLQAWV